VTFDESLSPEELREAVRLTFRSEGWTKVILPQLQERLTQARDKLESRHRDIDEIRGLQGEIRVLRDFVDDPISVFKVTR
jgi:Arc/MetJ-type ribon-helix-helix transcriptional regulator